MKPNKKWIAGRDDGEEFQSKLLEQKVLFERLYDIADEMEKATLKAMTKKSNYESPSWSEKQADAIGYARALSEIKNLLKFTKE